MITVTYATFIELPSFYSPRILGEPVRVESVDPVLRRSTSRYVPPSTRDPTAELEVILRPEADGHPAVAVLCLVGLEVTQPYPGNPPRSEGFTEERIPSYARTCCHANTSW